MAGREDTQVVLLNCKLLHVEHNACTAAQAQKYYDVRKHHIHAGYRVAVHLFFHTHTVLLDGL